MTPRTAVIGANGHAGSQLLNAYRVVDPQTIGTDWKSRAGLAFLDLGKPSIAALKLKEAGVEWAAIPASIRQFEVCERQPDYTRERNVNGTLELARQLTEIGIKISFFSSDGVFDGRLGLYTERDAVSPVNEYGRQKVAVETELLKMTGGRSLILRVSRILGIQKGDGTLLDQIAQNLISGKQVVAARDQIFSATLVDDIPPLLMALQAVNAAGVVHTAGPEPLSRLQIARKMAAALGVGSANIKEIGLDDITDGIQRPKNLSLNSEYLQKIVTFPLTSISACIARVASNYAADVKGTAHAT